MNKKTKKKIRIAQEGAKLYLKNSRYTMSALAEASGTEKDEIYDYFPNRQSVIEFYYEALMLQYIDITKQIDGYADFTLAEKLNNLALTVLDQMEEDREFVRMTYKKTIFCSSRDTSFEHSFRTQLKTIYQNDTRQSSVSSAFNNRLLYKAGLFNFHLLVKYWLEDSSTGNQKTMELVDKWTAFVQEIHYSSVLDRGFDFAKFLFYNSPLSSPFKYQKSDKPHE